MAGSGRWVSPWRPGSGPRRGSSKAIGKIQAAQILAAGFGPLLGGTLASLLGIRAAFWGASVSCLFAALVVALLYTDEKPARREPATAGVTAVADILPRGFFTALVFVVFFVNFASRSFTPILPAQLGNFGIAHSSLALSTGLLISVYSIAAAVSSFGFGRLAARSDPVRLIGLSLFASLLAAIAMAYMSTFEAFLGVALVYGLVSGGGLTLGYSIGSRRSSPRPRAVLPSGSSRAPRSSAARWPPQSRRSWRDPRSRTSTG